MTRGRAIGLAARVTAALALAAGALALPACGGGGGGEGSTISPCGLPDPAPSYAVGDEVSGCVATADGSRADVFAFTIPAATAGGDAQLQIDNVATGTVRATIYGSDDAVMGSLTAAAAGASLVIHLAAAGGVTYRLAVEDGGGFAGPYSYRLTSTFVPVPDTFEPNDTPAEATPIAMATPVDAFLFAGAAAMTAGGSVFDDYYQVTVTEAQTATVRIDNVPTDIAARLFLYRSDQTEIARVATGHRGESLVMQPPLPLDPGTYLVRVAPWAEVPAAVSLGAAPPDHFTRGYQLTVTQP